VIIGHLLGGAVIVEALFSLQGFGSYVLEGLVTRDYPVVQAGVLLGTAAFVLASIVVDATYGVIDPRVRSA
jgi:ABC-type dipeptide/oligopeptide/nickel transport system permease component